MSFGKSRRHPSRPCVFDANLQRPDNHRAIPRPDRPKGRSTSQMESVSREARQTLKSTPKSKLTAYELWTIFLVAIEEAGTTTLSRDGSTKKLCSGLTIPLNSHLSSFSSCWFHSELRMAAKLAMVVRDTPNVNLNRPRARAFLPIANVMSPRTNTNRYLVLPTVLTELYWSRSIRRQFHARQCNGGSNQIRLHRLRHALLPTY